MKLESNQQNSASFQITFCYELIQEEMNIKYLGLETENVWIGKWILVVCYPNWTVYAMWLDVWNIVTPSKLKMVYDAYLHSAMVYEINVWGNSVDSKKFFFFAKEIFEHNIGN